MNATTTGIPLSCPICKHGDMRHGTTSVTIDRPSPPPGGATIVFKDVPASVCDNCGEQYVDEATTAQLLRQATAAAKTGVQVEVRSYAA
jgi:YgiT-type zinc finger domain-containing protein